MTTAGTGTVILRESRGAFEEWIGADDPAVNLAATMDAYARALVTALHTVLAPHPAGVVLVWSNDDRSRVDTSGALAPEIHDALDGTFPHTAAAYERAMELVAPGGDPSGFVVWTEQDSSV